jgi:hypothetical protein
MEPPLLDRLARWNVRFLMWAFVVVGALFFLTPDGVAAVTDRLGSWRRHRRRASGSGTR